MMNIDPPEGSGDDVAGNNMMLLCKNGEYISASTNTPDYWGRWKSVRTCPPGEAVMGIKTRIERMRGSGDDTALNGVRLYCAKYEN